MPRAIPILSEFHNLSAGDLADQLGTLKAEIADLEARKRTIAGELIRRGVSEAEGALFRSLVVAETMVSTLDRQGIEKFRTLSQAHRYLGAWVTMLASPPQSPEWRGTPA